MDILYPSLIFIMVERSGEQTGERSIEVITNFFRLLRSPMNYVTVYSLEFTPDIEYENRFLRGNLLEKGRASVEAEIGTYIKTGNVLYAKKALNRAFTVLVKSDQNNEYVMKITPASTITGENVDSYRMYANSALKKMLQQLDLKQVTKLPKYYDTRQTQRIDQLQLEV